MYLTLYLAFCKPRKEFYVTEKLWLFPVILTIAVALCVVPLFDSTPEPYKVLAFGLIGGLLFVATAPAFKQEFEGNVHKYYAIVAGICALLWLILMNGVPLLAIVGYIVSVIDRKRCVFWIEFGLLSNVYYVLAFNVSAAHSFEVTEIELLDTSGVAEKTAQAEKTDNSPLSIISNNSISMTKLLDGVEKSYEPGKKLLDESKNLSDGEVLFSHKDGAESYKQPDSSLLEPKRERNRSARKN